jgi:hypothetical protein
MKPNLLFLMQCFIWYQKTFLIVLLHCCARMREEDYVIFVCINYRYHLMRMCVDFLFQSSIYAFVVISFLIQMFWCFLCGPCESVAPNRHHGESWVSFSFVGSVGSWITIFTVPVLLKDGTWGQGNQCQQSIFLWLTWSMVTKWQAA